jgi:hypothetical protein
MKSKYQIGKDFEKEAYSFLEDVFDEVIWLSKKNPCSHIDFECYKDDKKLMVEAKISQDNKPIIRLKQLHADFFITKLNNQIKLIPKGEMINYFYIEKEDWSYIRVSKSTSKELKQIMLDNNLLIYDDAIKLLINNFKIKQLKGGKN